jgi:polyisoprenoid-binding protein YceI
MRKTIYFFALLISSVFLFAFTQVSVKTASAPGTIQFIGDAGQATTFTVEDWKFLKVEMKDENPENVQVEIEMETASINASWKELVQSIKKKSDYFQVKSFPKAKVSIKGATKNADGTYSAKAQMTIREITKPVDLIFTILSEKPYKVKGEGTIIRQDFGFTGGGPKNEVPIMFETVLPLK